METNNVSLTISQDIVKPIVQSKIEEAILLSLGGADKLVEYAVATILNTKVDSTGKVSTYSNENKFNFVEIAIRNKINEAARLAVSDFLENHKEKIRNELIKQLTSKKGVALFAASLLDATARTLPNQYRATFTVNFLETKD